MSELTFKCPDGHSNSATQKFCGECGASLAGLCPKGQRYCGGRGRDVVGPLDRISTGLPES